MHTGDVHTGDVHTGAVHTDAVYTDAAQRAAPRDADQNRVRMPIVPTTWFAVPDAPPDVLMNA